MIYNWHRRYVILRYQLMERFWKCLFTIIVSFDDLKTTSHPYQDANLNCILAIFVCKRNRKAHHSTCAHLYNTHHIRRRTRSKCSRKRENHEIFFQAIFSVAALFTIARLFNLVTGLSQLLIFSFKTDKDTFIFKL